MILALSGGTGGSKMVDGLAQVHGQQGLAAVVNTGDDGDFYGLRVCPDLDICTYVLAGVADERGWGYAGDTFRCLEGLATYGREAWFGLGDRDLATHIHRTLRLAEGAGLAQVTAEICARLGVEARVLPMTEDAVRTLITTAAGPRSFQEYLVRDGAAEEIERIELAGAEEAAPAPGVLEAIAAAERIVICPSSPVVSIGTILAIAGVREALARRRADCVAVSPIISRRPVEGPADRFLRGAGYAECSATQMARIYADVAATFVLDASDAAEAPAIEALGVRPVLAAALMLDRAARARLASAALEAVAWSAPATWAVVPAKRLEGALRRLAPALGRPIRRELQVAMLRDVLGACAGASGLAGVLVVTSDPAVAALARELAGAAVIGDHDPPRGMNGAVARGLAAVAGRGAEAGLVMTADLPLARADDVDAILTAARPAPSAVLVPSHEGTGTNAMLLRPPGAITPRLGPDSLARHLALADRGGVLVRRLERPRLALDIDTPRDLAALIARGDDCATVAACARLSVGDRLAAGSAR